MTKRSVNILTSSRAADITTRQQMTTQSKEILNALVLSRISYYSLPAMRRLVREAGSFTTVMENRSNICDIVPDCSSKLASMLNYTAAVEERACREMEYARLHGIQVIAIGDSRYPARLAECDDAPLVLFFKGTADLNAHRVINIVGTRHATIYADDCIRRFVEDIKSRCPQLLIVSGLAYGVDIMAHRRSLENGIPTVGVLAHGLDTLYPPRHRETAERMIENGGLLTEHFTQTNADKVNFVRRNRIVAGMSDATIIVESAEHGGGLITCRMAQGYNRDVFAFPGRINDKYSQGCNNLIRDKKAELITCAEDFIAAMMWQTDEKLATAHRQGIERSLFPQFDGDAQMVAECLSKENDLQLNSIAASLGIPVNKVSAALFELEMKGAVKALPGGVFHLIK